MYNEESYARHLTWIKAKRIIFLILFSIIGSAVGVLISFYIVNLLMFDQLYRIVIITASTLLFFFISLLATANTAKEIQDGYWKIAALRKLTLISKKLDTLDNLEKLFNLEKLDKLDKLDSLDRLEQLEEKVENISKQLSVTNSINLISEKENSYIEAERKSARKEVSRKK